MSGQIKQRSIEDVPCVKFGIRRFSWVRQFQRAHKLWLDGYFETNTCKMFQKVMGAPIKGVLSRTNDSTVKEMQRQINAGEKLW